MNYFNHAGAQSLSTTPSAKKLHLESELDFLRNCMLEYQLHIKQTESHLGGLGLSSPSVDLQNMLGILKYLLTILAH